MNGWRGIAKTIGAKIQGACRLSDKSGKRMAYLLQAYCTKRDGQARSLRRIEKGQSLQRAEKSSGRRTVSPPQPSSCSGTRPHHTDLMGLFKCLGSFCRPSRATGQKRRRSQTSDRDPFARQALYHTALVLGTSSQPF